MFFCIIFSWLLRRVLTFFYSVDDFSFFTKDIFNLFEADIAFEAQRLLQALSCIFIRIWIEIKNKKQKHFFSKQKKNLKTPFLTNP